MRAVESTDNQSGVVPHYGARGCLMLMAEHLYLVQVSCALKAQHELLRPLAVPAHALVRSESYKAGKAS